MVQDVLLLKVSYSFMWEHAVDPICFFNDLFIVTFMPEIYGLCLFVFYIIQDLEVRAVSLETVKVKDLWSDMLLLQRILHPETSFQDL